MLFRFIILVFLLSACKAGEMACPEVKTVKLNKRPNNYRMRIQSHTVSSREDENPRADARPRQTRPTKSSDSIEEWDCPKPGSKSMPKSVKENIRKNKKKFESWYKNRTSPDSVQTGNNGDRP
jgi:hypothetical protein